MSGRYEILRGPNTNQWWVYDNEEDVYIGPPSFYLKEAEKTWHRDLQKKYLEDIVAERPGWLFDRDHWYEDLEP